ncbi:hypothetical protein BVRB_9g217000 isoform B [Beta vulgaris subsp. vulgaris]|nr:hypothetical protein BVRB_9g217000 isoform B [Beta vulgaris subsp. vulgaris]
MENITRTSDIFDMDALMMNLPRKGLSRYYSEKSRSFACLADVHTLDDLKKQDHRKPKKRKNYINEENMQAPPSPCRHISGNNRAPMPCIGV